MAMSEIPRHVLPPWMGGDPIPDDLWDDEDDSEHTPEEHAEFIRKVNAPGGAHITLSAREWGHRSKLPPVRDPAAVRELRASLAEEPPGNPFFDGIAAALDYAYGQTLIGPVSGEHAKSAPPTCRDLYGEEMIALRVIQRDLVKNDHPVPRHPDFVVGVEHTLMWLQCRTDSPPWGSGELTGNA